MSKKKSASKSESKVAQPKVEELLSDSTEEITLVGDNAVWKDGEALQAPEDVSVHPDSLVFGNVAPYGPPPTIEDFIEENGFPPEGEVKPEPFLGAEAASLSIEAMKAGLGIDDDNPLRDDCAKDMTVYPGELDTVIPVAADGLPGIAYGKHGFPAFGIPNYPKGSIILDNVDGRPTTIRVKDGQEVSEIDYMTHMKDCEILNIDGKTMYKHPLLEEPIELGSEGPMSRAMLNKLAGSGGETTTPYKLEIRQDEISEITYNNGTNFENPVRVPDEKKITVLGEEKQRTWDDVRKEEAAQPPEVTTHPPLDIQVDSLPETPVAQETMKTIKESIAEKRRMLPPPNALVVGGKPIGVAARTTKAIGTKPIVNAGGIVVHHPNNGVAGNRGKNIHNARPDKPIRNV